MWGPLPLPRIPGSQSPAEAGAVVCRVLIAAAPISATRKSRWAPGALSDQPHTRAWKAREQPDTNAAAKQKPHLGCTWMVRDLAKVYHGYLMFSNITNI